MSRMMLECLSCGCRRLLDLPPALLSDIGLAETTWMACEICERETKFKFADYGRRSGTDRRMNLDGPEQLMIQHERRILFSDRRQTLQRQKDRVPIQLPISIRYDNAEARFKEVTETINVSPRGVFFASARPYSEGATVYVTLNYSPANPGANIEMLGKVVRVEKPQPATDFKGVAVHLT